MPDAASAVQAGSHGACHCGPPRNG